MDTATTETQPATETSPTTTVEPVAPAPGEATTATEATASPETEATALGGEPEAKPVEETPAGPPEKYELSLEGVDLDAETVTQAEPILRELALSNDQANKLLPVAAALAERTSQRTIQAVIDQGAAQRKAWLDDARGADDIGGAKWDETLHVAAKGLDALGFSKDHPFRKVLNDTGFGNHPDMIRAMRKVGEIVGESGEFPRGNAAPKVERDVADRWYSTPKKEA